MKVLLTLILLLVVCFLTFLISNHYLPYHQEISADIKERCEREELAQEGSSESNTCRFFLDLAPNFKFVMEVVRFVSLCVGALLIGVVFYCLCDRERRLRMSLAREHQLAQRVGQRQAAIGQYQRRLQVNKKNERSFENKLDQRKLEVEAIQNEMEMMGQWNNSLTERNTNLGKQVKRQHVRDRANWARSTLQRKKETEMKKRLNRSCEEIGEKTRENQSLVEALAREREERERAEREYHMERDRTLAQHLAERDRLEREMAEERERVQRERHAERTEWERRVQEELRRRGNAQQPPRGEEGWCVVS